MRRGRHTFINQNLPFCGVDDRLAARWMGNQLPTYHQIAQEERQQKQQNKTLEKIHREVDLICISSKRDAIDAGV